MILKKLGFLLDRQCLNQGFVIGEEYCESFCDFFSLNLILEMKILFMETVLHFEIL